MVELHNYVSHSLDSKGNQVDVIYTDFQKAFDKVSHRLLARLKISASPRSFSHCSRHTLLLKGVSSRSYQCSWEAPQGWNLGPFFFLYANPRKIQNSNCLLFANDLKIFRELGKQEDDDMLQKDLDAVQE